MGDETAALILALVTENAENAELRAQLAESQDLLVKTDVDASELHAQVGELQTELLEGRSVHGHTALNYLTAIGLV